jgi:FAD/FMN-containing dehydrogenase
MFFPSFPPEWQTAVVAGARAMPASSMRRRLSQTADESVEWLKARGGTLPKDIASGNTIERSLHFTRRLTIDLIVLGTIHSRPARFWWGSAQRTSLAERANCCIFVAVNDPDASGAA